ncbi:YbhN family protein [Candidatus Altiarchaeota archaeon]
MKVRNYHIIAAALFIALLIMFAYGLSTGNLLLLFFAIILSAATYLCNTLMLKQILLCFGISTKFYDLFLIYVGSQSASYMLPFKAGLPLRVLLYNKKLEVDSYTGSAAVAMEMFLGVLVYFIISILGVLLFFDLSIQYSWFLFLVFLLLLAPLLSTLVFVLLMKRLPFLRQRFPMLDRFYVGITSFSKKMIAYTLIFASAWFFIGFFCSILRLHILLRYVGYTLGLADLFPVAAFALLVGSLSFLPAGLVVRDATFTALLVGLGVPLNVAILVAVVERIITTGIFSVVGVASLSILGLGSFKEGFHLPVEYGDYEKVRK